MSDNADRTRPVVILHGYSDNSQSFQPLAQFLKRNGYNVVEIWLAEYLSMYDELTIQDLGQAMGTALDFQQIPRTPKSFDLIAHSTGALVVRAYLCRYFYGRPDQCPIEHLVLLAPANFGSPLAALGKSMVGRLLNGWDWNHLFQTGTQILQALELASPISWELAQKDLFDPGNSLFRIQNLYTTILVGSESYGGLKELAHENGSDGTVRASTANLNARFVSLIVQPNKQIVTHENSPQYDPIAFGVLYGYNHGSIVNPVQVQGNDASSLSQLILDSLNIDSPAAYRAHVESLQKVTQETFQKGQASLHNLWYHEYQTISVRVHDQFGEMIPDYFLEFFQEENDPNDHVMQKVQAEILEKVTCYSADASFRSFLFDMTDMQNLLLAKGEELDLSLAVAAKSERVSYNNPEGYIVAASPSNTNFLMPNTTLLLDIQVERIQSPDVFKLRKFTE